MNNRNELVACLGEANVRLELGECSFGVLRAPRSFRIRCLRGSVWITHEAGSDDIVLTAGEQFQAAASTRVFVNAWKGALLAISGLPTPAGCRPTPISLRAEISKGAYRLSGGDAECRSLTASEPCTG